MKSPLLYVCTGEDCFDAGCAGGTCRGGKTDARGRRQVSPDVKSKNVSMQSATLLVY